MESMMTMPLFRSSTALNPEGFGHRAGAPSRKESLAIVSTSNRLCGIAAYTASLRRQLGDAFDITVFDLDQYLLRSPHRRVRKLADRHIKDICDAIRRFDVVNLQLEHGTLGRHSGDIYRRFCWITEAAPRLSVTFHTLLMPPHFDTTGFIKALATGRFQTATRMQADFSRGRLLSDGVARQLRRVQRKKQVSAIVHNRRDLYDATRLYGIRHVFDHPLSFLGAGEVEAIRKSALRRRFAMLDDLPPNSTLIGVFGFLNEYKGIGTAIQALHYLPNNHHLLIFGGVHPREIAPRQPRHPYIASLFEDAYIDTTLHDRLSAVRAHSEAVPLVVGADRGLRELLGAHPRDLSARIHFMGALPEPDFLSGMAICDAVVFPYLEVGQSSSGPISQALELGCRIIASRTHTFMEFAEYHANAVEFFDIGNHLELAERLLARRQFSPPDGLPEFNIETNKATYLLANGKIAGPPPDRDEPGRWAKPTRAERIDAININS
jgi:glycosyltransferase involved in cell wall biosynthesis